ncbi:MAG: hypothetical protein C5B50_20100 [Verrucomicrobia bacterium]|nr:MAG: hypothetical protein C5B50_20100 [Verrucomicrobiota bacterium]
MTLPFWEELDDTTFEEYCVALLNLRPHVRCEHEGNQGEQTVISAVRQLGGRRSQRGIDVRAKTDRGEEWLFQCKRVQSFGEDDARKVVSDAEAGFPKADHYVLVVTCGLSARTLDILARPKWLHPWDGSRLTTETQKIEPMENGINLVRRFFHRDDWVKRLFRWGDQPLLNWEEFFKDDLLRDRVFHHRSPIIAREHALTRLLAFAREGVGRALIFSGAGGQGKSRLLLELARRVEGSSEYPVRVRFLSLTRSRLLEDQADFLSREKELLLIVDDAHRLDAAVADVARAASRTKSIRLLVATRPHAMEAVKSQLFWNGYEARLEDPLRLGALSPEDMVKLAEEILGPQQSLHASRLAGLADRCPLLVVVGGTLLKAGQLGRSITDREEFRERVFKGFRQDFLRQQPEDKREKIDRLIQVLSFVSPATKGESLNELAASVIGSSAIEVAEDLEHLKAAGLVIENREGVRLYPDLFADAVLLNSCLDRSNQTSFFSKTLLEKISLSEFPAVMRNVAQADWEARSRKEARNSLFTPIWEQFLTSFKAGAWPDRSEGLSDFIERMFEREKSAPKPDRSTMLAQWASSSVFLPERTLELAKVAIETGQSGAMQDPDAHKAARLEICAALPPMLAPIVSWHPEFAAEALNLLWSLDVGDTAPISSNAANPVTAIATAASFDVHRHPTAAAPVVAWLEQKLSQPEAVDRIRQTPWILAALLKPFFERIIEHQWATANTWHVQPVRVPVAATRPLRQRALAISERFVLSQEKELAIAALPVLKEALSPIHGKFGADPSPADYEAWRPDRMDALKIFKHALEVHQNSTDLLLQLRKALLDRFAYDPDPQMKRACKEVIDSVPDSFDLRVARVLTSWSHDEIHVGPGPNLDAELAESEKLWGEFCRNVAQEVVTRFPDARALCKFLCEQSKELGRDNASFQANSILAPVAALSVSWCAELLTELTTAEDGSLDHFLWPVLHKAIPDAPIQYREALDYIVARGRSQQACALIGFLGWKRTHGGGLKDFEREVVMRLAERPEEPVVLQLASTVGLHFRQDPGWALTILSQLKPKEERSTAAILEALDDLNAAELDEGATLLVAKCFENAGERILKDPFSTPHLVQNLGQKFPKQLYEHLRNLVDQSVSEGHGGRGLSHGIDDVSVGSLGDTGYLAGEIAEQWGKALAGGPDEQARLSLTRCLLWSVALAVEARLKTLIERCQNSRELRLAARLAAPQGTAFVFRFPNLIRLLLMRGKELGAVEDIRETLYLSACGGGRSFTGGQLDPEYHYISAQAQDLANRYKDDAVLAPFYRAIFESERISMKRYQDLFQEEEETA